MSRNSNKYRLHNFLFDLVMLFVTCGLWIIWMVIREVRGLRS